MKTSSRRSIIASVIAAICIAPAAFAKHPKDDSQNPQEPGARGPAGVQGAPGNSGKHRKQGKSGIQSSVVPGRPGIQGPGVPGRPGLQSPARFGPGISGVRVVIPPPRIPPPPYYHRGSRRSSSDVGDSTVSAVQSALKQRGYYTGGVDGDAGPGTRGAINSFRQDNGLGASTRIDDPLLRALGL